MSMCHMAFCYCNKILQINNLKKEKISFDSLFWKFQSMVSWPHCLGIYSEAPWLEPAIEEVIPS
jgi:hypothetical protein